MFDGLTGAGASRSQSYTFEAFGNIHSLGGLSTPTSGTKYRLTSATYDTAGNLDAWNRQTYEYGPFNEMKHFCTTTPCQSGGGQEWIYLYTADDERIWAYNAAGTSGRWTLRDLDGKVLREFGSSPWSITEDYVYRDGQLLAGGQTNTHFHLDHLGTPRLVTNGADAKVAYHVYLPFGEEMTPINQDGTRLKFTGHERDLGNTASNQDDLDYMHARLNSPITGRFLSVDPVIAVARSMQSPQGWNRYAYVRGNPLKRIDRDGKFDFNVTTGGKVSAQCDPACVEAKKKAYAQQEALRKSLTPAVKAFYQNAFGVDLNALLSPGSGTTIQLATDDLALGTNNGSSNLGRGPLKLNMGKNLFGGDAKFFQATLLHESAHWAERHPGDRGSTEFKMYPQIAAARRARIDQLPSDKQFIPYGDGELGHAAEILQFGDILTITLDE